MISQFSLRKCIVYTLSVFLLIGQPLFAAKKNDLSGIVVGADGGPVKKAVVSIMVDGKKKEKKTRKKGKFEFKRIPEGEYTINVSHEEQGTAELLVTITDDKDVGEIPLSTKAPVTVASDVKTKPKETVSKVAKAPKAPSATGGASSDFILNELNFEIKKLTAEFKHLSREMDDLKALSKMWINPLTIYSKEIILKNGSTVFGKIVYQDDKSLKLETLVGYLIIERDRIVRIIDNVITEDQQEYIPEQIRESYSPPPMPQLTVPKYTSPSVSARKTGRKFSANCVLTGNIAESKDSQGNVLFKGEIKNIGGRRADFVKVDFVFRKNWSGETRTLTTFIKGSYNTFESGIVSDASLLPGAMGQFDLYVPQDFGSFIGYSYVIDWEEYH